MNALRIRSIFKRHWYGTKHNPPSVFDLFFWPVVDLLVWGLLTLFIQGAVELPAPAGFLIAGVLLWDLLFRSNLGIAMAFLEDASWSRNLINLMASPLRPSEYVAGAVAWSVARLLVTWSIMVALAFVFFQFSILRLGPVLGLFILAVMVFGVALAMIVLGLVLRFGPGADILAWGLAVLLVPVSAIYYPVDVLPGWGQAMANFIPTAHVFEAVRAVLAGGQVPWYRISAAMGLNALYLAGGLLFVRAMFETLRKRGFITRYM